MQQSFMSAIATHFIVIDNVIRYTHGGTSMPLSLVVQLLTSSDSTAVLTNFTTAIAIDINNTYGVREFPSVDAVLAPLGIAFTDLTTGDYFRWHYHSVLPVLNALSNTTITAASLTKALAKLDKQINPNKAKLARGRTSTNVNGIAKHSYYFDIKVYS